MIPSMVWLVLVGTFFQTVSRMESSPKATCSMRLPLWGGSCKPFLMGSCATLQQVLPFCISVCNHERACVCMCQGENTCVCLEGTLGIFFPANLLCSLSFWGAL